MEETLIQKLIDFVETASPVVWQAAYKQSYMEAFRNFVLIVFIALCLIYFSRWYEYFSTKAKKSKDIIANVGQHTNDWQDKYSMEREAKLDLETAYWGMACFGFMIAVGGVLMTFLIYGAVARVANPDYYAIKILADMVGL